jgi:hypothetical protein
MLAGGVGVCGEVVANAVGIVHEVVADDTRRRLDVPGIAGEYDEGRCRGRVGDEGGEDVDGDGPEEGV